MMNGGGEAAGIEIPEVGEMSAMNAMGAMAGRGGLRGLGQHRGMRRKRRRCGRAEVLWPRLHSLICLLVRHSQPQHPHIRHCPWRWQLHIQWPGPTWPIWQLWRRPPRHMCREAIRRCRLLTTNLRSSTRNTNNIRINCSTRSILNTRSPGPTTRSTQGTHSTPHWWHREWWIWRVYPPARVMSLCRWPRPLCPPPRASSAMAAARRSRRRRVSGRSRRRQ